MRIASCWGAIRGPHRDGSRWWACRRRRVDSSSNSLPTSPRRSPTRTSSVCSLSRGAAGWVAVLLVHGRCGGCAPSAPPSPRANGQNRRRHYFWWGLDGSARFHLGERRVGSGGFPLDPYLLGSLSEGVRILSWLARVATRRATQRGLGGSSPAPPAVLGEATSRRPRRRRARSGSRFRPPRARRHAVAPPRASPPARRE